MKTEKFQHSYPHKVNNNGLTNKNLLKFKYKNNNEIFNLIFFEEPEPIGTHLNSITRQRNKLFFLKNKLTNEI